jgi:hypothetical protein
MISTMQGVTKIALDNLFFKHLNKTFWQVRCTNSLFFADLSLLEERGAL